MTLRRLLVILSMIYSSQAFADMSVFYEDDQAGYHSWGVRTNFENLSSSHAYDLRFGLSADIPNVMGREYLSSYGHIRADLFANSFISPFAELGIDLLELGVFLFSDGEIAPQLDTRYAYGLRIKLGGIDVDAYYHTRFLSGYTIIDGSYSSYGVAISHSF